jgi:hypothetical protein
VSTAEVDEDSSCPLMHLTSSEDSIYSQNGEDGVLLRMLEIIGTTNKKFLEFGVEDGMQCNSRILRERCNFTGLMWDGSNENVGINLRKEIITVGNVIDLFEKYKVDMNLDVMSVDVDLFDWWILLRVLRRGYRPRVLIVEVNPTLGVSDPKFRSQYHHVNSVPLVVIPPEMTTQETWDLSRYAGANPLAYNLMVSEFGYHMVHCDICGVNCFFVRTDAAPSTCALATFPLPKYSYPCYGTTLTGGAYPGHVVDFDYQPPVRLSRDLLSNIVIGGYSLFDVARYLFETSADYISWGRDICSFVYDDFNDMKRISVLPNQSLYGTFSQGVYEFKSGNFEAALNSFMLSFNQFVGDAANTCFGDNWSVFKCRIPAILLYNAAISSLNTRSPARLSAVASLFDQAASYVKPSLKHLNRIQFYGEFFRRLKDPDVVKSFVFVLIPLRRSVPTLAPVAITFCTDETTAFDAICRKHGIDAVECSSITRTMRDGYKTHIINYPNAYLNRDKQKKDVVSYKNWLDEFIPDIGAPFREGGCVGDIMSSFELQKRSICKVSSHSLISIFGFGGRNLLNAVGRKIRAGGNIVFEEVAETVDELAKGLVQYTNSSACDSAFFSFLDPGDCSPDILRQVQTEELSGDIQLNQELLMNMYIRTYGVVFDLLSNRNDIFGMIVANPSAPFIYGSMTTIVGGLFSQLYNIVVVPPMQIAIASIAKERAVNTDTALLLLVEHTNRLIDANKRSPIENVLFMTFSKSENLDFATSLFGADVVKSIDYVLFEVIGPQKDTVVRAPVWFYNCYESIRVNLKFPEEVCASDL